MIALTPGRLLVATFVAAAGALLLLAAPLPAPEDEAANCVTSVRVSPALGFVKNCDSKEFMKLARDPALLFSELSRWQSRPGFVLLGSWLAKPFVAIDGAGREGVIPRLAWHPFYAGFVLMNFLALVLAVVLFLRLTSHSYPAIVAVLPVAALVVNEVTKAFFWTPHLQIFTLLVPLLAMNAAVWGHEGLPRAKWTTLAAAGLAMGGASLVYGSFLLVPLALCAAVLASMRHAERKGTRRDLSARLALVTGCSAAVVIAWRSYVVWRTGAFAAHEVQGYRQFVWIVEDARAGVDVLVGSIQNNASEFLATVPSTIGAYGLLLSGCVVAAVLSGAKLRELVARDVSGAALSYIAVAIPFLFFLGFYRTRLTWLLVPPLLVLAAHVLEGMYRQSPASWRRVAPVMSVAAAAAYLLYWVTRSGPYS